VRFLFCCIIGVWSAAGAGTVVGLFWAKIGAAREVALAKVETVDYRFSAARGLTVATRSGETAARIADGSAHCLAFT
jgi:hypothetical protein